MDDNQAEERDISMINGESIDKEGIEFIETMAEEVITQILRVISSGESARLYTGEKLGKSMLASVGQRRLEDVDIAIKDMIIQKLKDKGIGIIFLSDPNFPDDIKYNDCNYCIYRIRTATKIIVA